MKTRNVVMIVAVALIFLVGGGLAIYAAVRHEQTIGTEEHFSGMDEGFTHPERRWDRVPLTIACAGFTASHAGECEEVRSAAAAINHRVGFTLLRWRDSTRSPLPAVDVPLVPYEHANIRVWAGAPAEEVTPDHNGFTELRVDGTRYTACQVRIWNTGTDELLFLVAYHEVACHCFGLDHDAAQTSICRATQVATPMGAFPPRLSDHDRALLRDRYGPQ